MHRLIFIKGPMGSGKTALAETLSAGGKSAYGRPSGPWWLSHLKGDEEYLIFEEDPGPRIYDLDKETIKIDRMGKEPLEIKTPRVIFVICQQDKKIRKGYLVIEMQENR